MPLFSVIIPTYNRASDLDRCLASLVAQTNQDFEVIVCDDGSTDNTRAVAEAYQAKLKLIYDWAENWGGPAKPRNRGLKLAQADWICFLDSDDWWYPGKLAACARYLDSADIIYHDLDVYDCRSEKPLWRLRSWPLADNPFIDLMLNNNALFNSSVVVKKNVLEQVGGLTEDPNLISVEDLDCWLKIAKQGKKFFYLPEVLGAYWLGTNISRSLQQAASLEALWRRHEGDLRSPSEKDATFRTLKYGQARIYQFNKYYGRALSAYWQAGPLVLANRLLKYFNLKKSKTQLIK